VSKYASETLRQFIKKSRLERGLTQKQLAEKVGVNEMSVVAWEKNHRIPKNKNLLELGKFFKVKEKIFFNLMPSKTSG
jgi:transcriptional regulator with XRE-family HTH domain